MQAQEQLAQWIGESERMVFFGGAGVSTESGIPDFRSVDGLYHQQYAYPPEVMLSHDFFLSHTAEFYDFYRSKMLRLEAKPNPAHLCLARWEREGRLQAVVTQNIDGLHQAAGSQRVLELHGTVHRNLCTRCGRVYDARFILESTGVPHCSCGGLIKPDVVLYGEGLDGATVQEAVEALRQADLVLVGGTSLNVYPAAGLLEEYRGHRLVLINRSPTPYDRRADLLLSGSIGEILGSLPV